MTCDRHQPMPDKAKCVKELNRSDVFSHILLDQFTMRLSCLFFLCFFGLNLHNSFQLLSTLSSKIPFITRANLIVSNFSTCDTTPKLQNAVSFHCDFFSLFYGKGTFLGDHILPGYHTQTNFQRNMSRGLRCLDISWS